MDKNSSDNIIISLAKKTFRLTVFGIIFAAGSFFSGIFENYLAYLNLPDGAKPTFFEQPVSASIQTTKLSAAFLTLQTQKISAPSIASAKFTPIPKIQGNNKTLKVVMNTSSSQDDEICDAFDGELVSDSSDTAMNATEQIDEIDCDCEATDTLDEAPPI